MFCLFSRKIFSFYSTDRIKIFLSVLQTSKIKAYTIIFFAFQFRIVVLLVLVCLHLSILLWIHAKWYFRMQTIWLGTVKLSISARTFGYFCTWVPVGYLNGYPGTQCNFRAVRSKHTPSRPSGIVTWDKLVTASWATAPPYTTFYTVGKFPSYQKNVPVEKKNLLFTEE